MADFTPATLLVLVLCGVWCVNGYALSGIFNSNMVLQRTPAKAVIWGTCTGTEVVTVVLDSKLTYTSKCNSTKQWSVALDAQNAGSGHVITVSSSSSTTKTTLTNIAFGDVWLCSGQSNMQMTVNVCCLQADNSDCDADMSDSINYPNLRFYTLDVNPSRNPTTTVRSAASYNWGVSGPTTINGEDFVIFSAACYYFGRQVYTSLGGNVPIGLLVSSDGGTLIESWSSPDALAACVTRNGSAPMEHSSYTETRQVSLPTNQNDPSAIYNGMINPLLPMRFAGVVWYQGEQNENSPGLYACQFPAMISDWRQKFGSPNLPFIFTQLAGTSETTYQLIRESQMAALELPYVTYATAVDLSDPTSPYTGVHPRRKKELGRRLGLAALNAFYGSNNALWTGPVLQNITVDVNSDLSSVVATMNFQYASGLHSSGTGGCTSCCGTSPFIVRTFDGGLTRMTYTIQGSTVIAKAAISTEVVSVEYEYEGMSQCSLYNGVGGVDDGQGIAALPFRYLSPTPSWRLVTRQTYPYLFTASEWSLNPTQPNAANFAILDQLSNMTWNGVYELKMRWPANADMNIWQQTSNPIVNLNVTGYKAIQVAYTSNKWEGLKLATSNVSLLDGSTTGYYQVGAYEFFRKGFKAYSGAKEQIELYVQPADDWVLVYRQTYPRTFQVNQWSLNPHDSGNDMFSILDQLEQYRRSDGTFRFKLYWPSSLNWWRQQSNPVTSATVQGYRAVRADHTTNSWDGLALDNKRSLLTGSKTGWNYAVGAFSATTSGYPAYGTNQNVVELFARVG